MPALSPSALAKAWPNVMPMSSTVWCASMCRSPFAEISRSNTPWRATCSSMWSRKGTPVAIFDLPFPSRLSLTPIFVSLVLRVTSALRMAVFTPLAVRRARMSPGGSTFEGLFQGGEESGVLVRCADRDPQAIREQSVGTMETLDEHSALLQSVENALRFAGSEQYEVGVARIGRDARHSHQFPQQAPTLYFDGPGLFCQHVAVLQHFARHDLGKRIDIVRQPHLVELPQPPRSAGQHAQPDARQSQFGERAHDEQIGVARQARHEAVSRERVVRLV